MLSYKKVYDKTDNIYDYVHKKNSVCLAMNCFRSDDIAIKIYVLLDFIGYNSIKYPQQQQQQQIDRARQIMAKKVNGYVWLVFGG